MGTITTTDGTEIFYKDWGSGQPIVFSHGWPLSADDWDAQMMFFLQHGYRVIAHDRRGHGRSSQTPGGHEMDTYAADVAALAQHLDLHDAVHVGVSTGGGRSPATATGGSPRPRSSAPSHPSWSRPTTTRVFRPRSSTASARARRSTVRSSSSTSPAARSTGSIARARPCRRA